MFVEPFKVFDPVAGDPPSLLSGHFEDVLRRARKILDDWDTESIKQGADTVDWIGSSQLLEAQFGPLGENTAEIDLDTLDEISEKDSKSLDEAFEKTNYSEPRQIYLEIRRLVIPETDAHPRMTWSEAFAIAALAYIGDVCTRFARWRDQKRDPLCSKNTDDVHVGYQEAGCALFDATEAIAIAEQLEKYEALVSEVADDAKRKEGRKYAMKGHANRNRLKRDYFDFHDVTNWPSFAESRRKFLEKIGQDAAKLGKNPNKILENAMRERNRGRKR